MGYEKQQLQQQAKLVPITKVKVWMERLQELIRGYFSKDILNMDELRLIFKTLPQKGLVEKGKKGRGGKQSEKRCSIALFVSANSSKVCDLTLEWRSKKPCYFKNLKHISHRLGVHYFTNAKAWMTTEICRKS